MLSHLIAPALARRGIHYGWVIVAVSFMTMLATAATAGIPGVLMLPLNSEFGWDLSSISGALALRLMLLGLIAPFAAALMKRYGMRRVVCIALATIVVGLSIAARMSQLWHLWLAWGVMLGLCTGMTANVLGATVASRWFTKRRGLVVGLLSASNATGTLLFLPIAAWLAQNYGWRAAVLPATIACAVCLVLMLLLLREYPADLELPAYGEAVVVRPDDRRAGGNAFVQSFKALADASRSRVFWIIGGGFFVCGLSTSGLIQNHFIPLCHDFGMDAITASGLLAMMGACDFVGTIGSGWLSDRFDNRWLLFWYYGLRGLSLLILPYSNFSFYGLSLFAVFYGLDWIATVPPTVRISAQTFGKEQGPMVFGWMFTAHQLGGAFAALGAGITRDVFETYLPAFTLSGVACVVAAFAIVTIRQRPAAVVVAAE